MQGMIETATCVHRSSDSRRNSETGTQHKRDRKQATKRDSPPPYRRNTPTRLRMDWRKGERDELQTKSVDDAAEKEGKGTLLLAAYLPVFTFAIA